MYPRLTGPQFHPILTGSQKGGTMALSMSVSAGAHNARHNTDLEYRSGLDNVDPTRSHLNEVLADESIDDAYGRLFGDALAAYNAKQVEKGHPDRAIADYRAKVEGAYRADAAKVASGKKGRGNVPKPCYEYVFQIGDRDTWRQVPIETLKEVYKEAFERVRERTAGAIYWFQASEHFDEQGAGHLHVAGIAYGSGNKRGLEVQVSMSQALRTLGLKRLPDLQNLFMKELEAAAHEHGIERDIMGCDREHRDVAEWKQAQRDVADMTERLEAKTGQVAGLDAEITDKQRRLERLQGEIGGIAEKIAQREAEIESDKEERRALEGAQRFEESRAGKLEGAIAEVRAALREVVDKLKGVLDGLREAAMERQTVMDRAATPRAGLSALRAEKAYESGMRMRDRGRGVGARADR